MRKSIEPPEDDGDGEALAQLLADAGELIINGRLVKAEPKAAATPPDTTDTKPTDERAGE